MLEYLINMSLIWLIGLIVFDTLLKKETYHNYNRIYLFIILIGGCLLPLWSWDNDSIIYYSEITAPIANQSSILKESIITAATPKVLSLEDWLWYIYIIGCVFCTLKLLWEFHNIITLYRTSDKARNGVVTIVNVKYDISPFSAFGYIFMQKTADYSGEEREMIIAHEAKHAVLLHTIDLLLIRLFNILFWFHPLIYIIEKRLLMVHEYQADEAVKKDPAIYSKFLIEQSSLKPAPYLSHSFTRSPLKNRIIMLTRKSRKTAQVKKLIVIPLLSLILISCTQAALSDTEPQKNGNVVTYRGNTIEYNGERKVDTSFHKDPATGTTNMTITETAPYVTKLNGEEVYDEQVLIHQKKENGFANNSATSLTQGKLKEYILKGLDNELKSLADGKYSFHIYNIIVDKEGNTVYFEYRPLNSLHLEGVAKSELSDDTKKAFEKRIRTLMDNIPIQTPAQHKGKNVHSVSFGYYEKFIIRNGTLET